MTIVRVCVLVYVLFALWLIAKFETVLLALLISDVLDDPKPQAVMRMNPTKLICESANPHEDRQHPGNVVAVYSFEPTISNKIQLFSLYLRRDARALGEMGGASSSAVINLNRLHPNSVSISEESQADQVG